MGRQEAPHHLSRRTFLIGAAAAATTPFAIRIAGSARAEDIPLETTTEVFTPPKIDLIRTDPLDGEGIWKTEGLPQSPDNIMYSALLRPDVKRSDAIASLLILDHKKTKLNIMVGTADGWEGRPGGSGIIPEEALQYLAVTTAGGWQPPHGEWGLYSNGVEHKPLKAGWASLVTLNDGSFKMGTWGEEGFDSTEGVTAVRQNGVLLVKNGELTSDALRQGDDYIWKWFVNSQGSEAPYNAWRAGCGVTEDGNLIIVSGWQLTAETLAITLKSAKVKTGMQMDLNHPFVRTIVYDHEDKKPIPKILFASDTTDPYVDLGTKGRDFIYITTLPKL